MKQLLSDFYDHCNKFKVLSKKDSIDFFIQKRIKVIQANTTDVVIHVCKEMNKSFNDVVSKSRKRENVVLRQMIMRSLVEDVKIHPTKAASVFGQSRCNALHAIKEIRNLCYTNSKERVIYNDVRNHILSYNKSKCNSDDSKTN